MPLGAQYSASASSSPQPRLSGYEFLEEIRRDSTSCVYRARQNASGLEADVHCFSAPNGEQRITWEAEIAQLQARLGSHRLLDPHPSIQKVFDCGLVEGVFFVVLEHLEGQTLAALLQRWRIIPLEAVVRILEQLAGAIDYMAASGLAHNNLSPETIVLVGRESKVCIVGFSVKPSTSRFPSAFVAPERFINAPVDARADIYSMGAILYRCLSGAAPFSGSSNEDLVRNIGLGIRPPLTGQPRYVQDVIARLMSLSPALRYPVAIDAVQDLIHERSPELPTEAVVRIMPSLRSSGKASIQDREFDPVLPAQNELRKRQFEHGTFERLHRVVGNLLHAPYNTVLTIQSALSNGIRRLLGRTADPKEEDVDAPGKYRRVAPPSARRLRIQSTLQKLCGFSLRIAVIILLGLLMHGALLASQQRYTVVKAAQGHPIAFVTASKRQLQTGDKIDVATASVVTSDSRSSLDLDYGGARVRIRPGASVTLKPIQYRNGPWRSIELHHGMTWVEVGSPGSGQGSLLLRHEGVRIRAQVAAFACIIDHNGLRVIVDQGDLWVSSGQYKKHIKAGYQAEIPRNQAITRSKVGSGTPRDKSFAFAAPGQRSFLTRVVDAYLDGQHRLLVPLMNQAVAFRGFRPGTTGSLEDTQSLIKAQTALLGICKAFMLNGEPPSKVNLATLGELGLEPRDTRRILNCFEDHRLLAYYRLAGDRYILFCRAHDSDGTLLESNTGKVRVLKEEEEEKAFADADQLSATSLPDR